jgi:hypothetical protein
MLQKATFFGFRAEHVLLGLSQPHIFKMEVADLLLFLSRLP